MKPAFDQFKNDIARVRALGAVYKFINAQTTQVLNLDDLLRSQLVMVVSAFDLFIHELVRLGMLEIQRGHRPPTPAFLKFSVPMESVRECLNTHPNLDWLDKEVRNRHAFATFQRDEKVAEAIRLISDVKIWEVIALAHGKTTVETKAQLNLIANRRNKIAHEADIDPTTPGLCWPIDELLVTDAVNFLENVAQTIYSSVQIDQLTVPNRGS